MSNIEIIRELYAAFAAEGLGRVLELCDSDCVVTQDDALPWGGRYEGLDGVATFAIALGGAIDSVITDDAMYEAGDRVIQCGRSRGTVLATGAGFDMPEVHVWTLRDGLVTAAEFYIDTHAMLDVLSQAS
jgi:ketosteroid isomerase-like protein